MNYMKQVAQMLGVELGEEFKLKDYYNHALDGTFYLDSYGAFKKGYVTPMNNILIDIIAGEIEITKIPKPILDEEEKKYLSGIIKPLRHRVKFITKLHSDRNGTEYICIVTHDSNITTLPDFEKGKMYEGMELNKTYSLEDLDL